MCNLLFIGYIKKYILYKNITHDLDIHCGRETAWGQRGLVRPNLPTSRCMRFESENCPFKGVRQTRALCLSSQDTVTARDTIRAQGGRSDGPSGLQFQGLPSLARIPCSSKVSRVKPALSEQRSNLGRQFLQSK